MFHTSFNHNDTEYSLWTTKRGSSVAVVLDDLTKSQRVVSIDAGESLIGRMAVQLPTPLMDACLDAGLISLHNKAASSEYTTRWDHWSLTATDAESRITIQSVSRYSGGDQWVITVATPDHIEVAQQSGRSGVCTTTVVRSHLITTLERLGWKQEYIDRATEALADALPAYCDAVVLPFDNA